MRPRLRRRIRLLLRWMVVSGIKPPSSITDGDWVSQSGSEATAR